MKSFEALKCESEKFCLAWVHPCCGAISGVCTTHVEAIRGFVEEQTAGRELLIVSLEAMRIRFGRCECKEAA